MIIKSKVGSGFKGTIMYQYEGRKNENDKDKRSEILMSNEVYLPKSHDDKDGRKQMIKSFVQHAKELNPNFKNVVQHTVISFAKEDEKKIDEDLMKNVVGDYLKKAGLQNSQYVVFIHNDTDHKHLHIVANRIDLNGKTVSDRYIKMRDVERANIISRKYGLHQTLSNEVSKSKKGNEYNKVKEKRELNLPNIKFDKLNGADKTRLEMYRDISITLQNKKSENIIEFQSELSGKGIKVNFHEKDEKIYGISFEKDGYNISGSKIDKEFSYGRLIGHFNSVEKEKALTRQFTPEELKTKEILTIEIKDALSKSRSMTDFQDVLDLKGVDTSVIQKIGQRQEIVFEKGSLKIKGAEIEGNLSLNKIEFKIENNQYQYALNQLRKGNELDRSSLSDNVTNRLNIKEAITKLITDEKLEKIDDFLKGMKESKIDITFTPSKTNKEVNDINFEIDGKKYGGTLIENGLNEKQIQRKLDTNQYKDVLKRIEEGENIDKTALNKGVNLRLTVKDTIDKYIELSKSLSEFENHLKRENVSVLVTERVIDKENNVVEKGIGYSLNYNGFSGNDIGQKYTFENIQNKIDENEYKHYLERTNKGENVDRSTLSISLQNRLSIKETVETLLNKEKVENYKEFTDKLKENGIIISMLHSSDKVTGFRFEKGESKFKNSTIDKNLGYEQLIRRLDNNRYQKILEQIEKGQNVNRKVLPKDFQVRLEIKDTIKDVLSQKNSSYQVFEDRLKKEGISSVLQEKDGKIVGVSFEKEGLKYHSREIDGKLSIKSILHDLSKNIEKTDRDKEQNQAVTTGNSVLDELARLQSGKPMKKGKTKDISRGR